MIDPTADRPAHAGTRPARRAARTLAARRRLSRVAAILLACGTTLFVTSLFFVSVGGAAGSVSVTPNTGLTDGQQVTVSWTGLTPSFSPVIEQCNAAPVNPTNDCDFLTLQVADSNSAGAGTDTFNVFAGGGPSHLFPCDDQHGCTIRVADDPNDITTGAIGAITFSTAATTTSSTSTSSTSATSSTSSSSSSSTTTTTTGDGSTTTTTTGDGSTTTTSDPTAVLGAESTNSGTGGDSGLVLAFTGTALHLPFTLFAGGLLLVVGLVVRRVALAS